MDIKKNVREKYGEIARNADKKKACGCSCGCSDDSIVGAEYSMMNESYDHLNGYEEDADLKLGCGMPTEFAAISKGDTVVDLGSGAGNDCFVARAIAGESGQVIGLDFTPEMIVKANQNREKLGYNNVQFILGDIEQMPIDTETAEVVVSNCVLNLVPDKAKAFAEIFRILKKSGHFCVSDIVLKGNLPEKMKEDVVMYAGCVAGAVQREEYLEIIRKAGFENIQIKKERIIEIPDDLLKKHISEQDYNELKSNNTGIYSITVYAEKPGIVSMNNYNYADEQY